MKTIMEIGCNDNFRIFTNVVLRAVEKEYPVTAQITVRELPPQPKQGQGKFVEWAENHYWDSLQKDKDLILKHIKDNWQPIPCKGVDKKDWKAELDGPIPWYTTQLIAGLELEQKTKEKVDDKNPCAECQRPYCNKVCDKFDDGGDGRVWYCVKCNHAFTCHAQGEG